MNGKWGGHRYSPCVVLIFLRSVYLSPIPPPDRCDTRPFLRWVQSQGRRPHASGIAKNTFGPIGIPLIRCAMERWTPDDEGTLQWRGTEKTTSYSLTFYVFITRPTTGQMWHKAVFRVGPLAGPYPTSVSHKSGIAKNTFGCIGILLIRGASGARQ